MSSKTLDYSFKEIDGKVQMRDLRSPAERESGVELSKDDIITRLSVKLVTMERLLDQTFRDTEKEIGDLNERIRQMAPYHECYHLLQKSILECPTLIQEWQRFCLLLKLTDPDEEKYNQVLGR